MEMELVNSLVVTGGILLVSLAWIAFNWVWLRPKKLERHLRKQGLSGNSYRFLFGDVKDNSRMIREAKSAPINISDDIVPRVVSFLHYYIKTYGKKTFFWLGPRPAVIITEPEQVKEILTKNFHFKKPKLNPVVKFLITGLVAHEDEQWVNHRKLINPAFHVEKLKNMLPAFYLSSSEMVAKWENLVGSNQGSIELDIWQDLQTMTSDVISRTAFGSNYEEGRRIFRLLRELTGLAILSAQSVYIPGWRFLPTKMNKKLKQVDSEINSALKGIIEKRLKEMNAREYSNTDDLLGILLESNRRETESHDKYNKNVGMSIKEVIDECRIFYFAGQETTASLLVWTMVLLSNHQNWQQKAREEVLEVFGHNDPTFDGLSRLKIVTMILYEVLRLYPPAPFLTRTVSEDTNLGEVVIPAGTILSIPIIVVHNDFKIWGDDAKDFKPERFSEGIAKATKNQQVSYIPFSWGPRICIGQNFALLEAKMAMAMILQRFSFELSPSYAHAPASSGTLQPEHGAHLTLHKCC